MLDYGEPQILEVFKNTSPSHLNWVFLPIKYWRQAVETAERILTKEKSDRQLAGQNTEAAPFLTVNEENEQRHMMVVFNESNIISAKIDMLTLMLGKLLTQNRQSKPMKPRLYQGGSWTLIN